MAIDKDFEDALAGNAPKNPHSQAAHDGAAKRISMGLPPNPHVNIAIPPLETSIQSIPISSNPVFSSFTGELTALLGVGASLYMIASTVFYGHPFHIPSPIKNKIIDSIYETVDRKEKDDRDTSQMRRLLEPFEKRSAELKDQMITQPLLRYGFQCTNSECTANGLKIQNASCSTSAGIPRMRIYSDSLILGYSCAYEFYALNDPGKKYYYNMSLHFVSTRNIFKLGYDTNEVITSGYQGLFMDDYVNPENARVTTYDANNRPRYTPLNPAFVKLFKNLTIAIPYVESCKGPYFVNPSMWTTNFHYGRVVSSPQFNENYCWNVSTMTAQQARYYQATTDRKGMYNPFPDSKGRFSYSLSSPENIAVRPAQLNGKPLGSRAWIYPLSLVF